MVVFFLGEDSISFDIVPKNEFIIFLTCWQSVRVIRVASSLVRKVFLLSVLAVLSENPTYGSGPISVCWSYYFTRAESNTINEALHSHASLGLKSNAPIALSFD